MLSAVWQSRTEAGRHGTKYPIPRRDSRRGELYDERRRAFADGPWDLATGIQRLVRTVTIPRFSVIDRDDGSMLLCADFTDRRTLAIGPRTSPEALRSTHSGSAVRMT